MSFQRRQALVAALTGDALRPVPVVSPGVASMLAGWFTACAELPGAQHAFDALPSIRSARAEGAT